MQKWERGWILVWLLVCAPLPARAIFSSLYVFGDGLSTTTNAPGGSLYYGKRYSNGRVWVEVLAQRQQLAYEANQNWSYFGHYSSSLITNLNAFGATNNAGDALFVVWVNNADFVGFLAKSQFAPYASNNLAVWTNAINQSLSNHSTAIQILYAKGARTLVMPNAADLTKVPYYVGLSATNKSFIRQRIMDFNAGFTARLEQARATFPNLTIHSPDIFSLLDYLITHPADYGLTNALYNGQSIDALSDPLLTDKALNGAGTNYIYWDYLDPTAKAHTVLADFTQQILSPSRIHDLVPLSGGIQLNLTNVPVGRDGIVEGSVNLLNWTFVQSFPSTNATQQIPVTPSGPFQFYRLRFPFSWSWP